MDDEQLRKLIAKLYQDGLSAARKAEGKMPGMNWFADAFEKMLEALLVGRPDLLVTLAQLSLMPNEAPHITRAAYFLMLGQAEVETGSYATARKHLRNARTNLKAAGVDPRVRAYAHLLMVEAYAPAPTALNDPEIRAKVKGHLDRMIELDPSNKRYKEMRRSLPG